MSASSPIKVKAPPATPPATPPPSRDRNLNARQLVYSPVPATPPATPPPSRDRNLNARQLVYSPEPSATKKRDLNTAWDGAPQSPAPKSPSRERGRSLEFTPTRVGVSLAPPGTPQSPDNLLFRAPRPRAKLVYEKPLSMYGLQQSLPQQPGRPQKLSSKLASIPDCCPPETMSRDANTEASNATGTNQALTVAGAVAQMKTEPWYTLEDADDEHAKLFELKFWQFVKMMGPLDEDESTLECSFGGCGDSLRSLHYRLQRLQFHLQSGRDSLSALDTICKSGSSSTPSPCAQAMPTLLNAVRTRPFAPLKIAAHLPELRAHLCAAGLAPEFFVEAARRANELVALAAAVQRLLDPALAQQWGALQGLTECQAADVANSPQALEALRLQHVRDYNRANSPQALEALRLQHVRDYNCCSKQLVKIFAAAA
eukprot:CAMPEP_0174317462 /NCGR_PEP_ID=MMETSP0810-20121108/7593_1 /TAXON_ID=73025 ORGANISM="Eutreptiella gymnastica-like, Strain CCMP1594" /NCGR_SAMPLE_ID=MMETSP0810 /ASSEMBLY_ACC=CAM_ASM_000659 /LENGTH=427 /DNA_ID=CAMNT_0015427437 /DNA_START=31 /DNA_END=1314 /DNA_ORIENTATION=-